MASPKFGWNVYGLAAAFLTLAVVLMFVSAHYH